MAGDGALEGIFTYVGWAFLPNVSAYDFGNEGIRIDVLTIFSSQHLRSRRYSTT
jgi:hypothetical protein